MAKVFAAVRVGMVALLAATAVCAVGWSGGGVTPEARRSSAAVIYASAPVIENIEASPEISAARIRVKTHVLLLSSDILADVQIPFTMKVPTHHVRPDTAETLNDAGLIDNLTAQYLLAAANYDEKNFDFNPPDKDYPQGQDQFDCLSDLFRGPEIVLPVALRSSVIDGLSLQYKVRAAADGQGVAFAPLTMMRADYPASEAPNTAAHGAPFEHSLSVTLPPKGTLLLDAGPVKANRAETTPSKRLLVLLQAEVVGKR
jgi:hypothetical protein